MHIYMYICVCIYIFISIYNKKFSLFFSLHFVQKKGNVLHCAFYCVIL